MAEFSICIPRVFANIRWKRVKSVFEQLGLGEIDRVDLVSRTNDEGDNFQRCFVHFKSWADTQNAQAVREELEKGGNIKVIYDDPWFWKCYKSRVQKPEQAPKSVVRRQPTIELEGGKIIRSTQRAGARKVGGRRGDRSRTHGQRRNVQREHAPPNASEPVVPPDTSVTADEFLARLSTNASQDETGPTTPPGSPTSVTAPTQSPRVEAST